MKSVTRILLLAAASALLVGCAQKVEPTAISPSDSGKDDVSVINIERRFAPIMNARKTLEWRRAREERRPASPVF